MKENKFEGLKNFEDFVILGQKMSPEEAIEHLCAYHNSTKEAVLVAFMNLRDFVEGTVKFRRSVNNGNPCIVMEGCDNNGKYSWNHLINDITGQPQSRTS